MAELWITAADATGSSSSSGGGGGNNASSPSSSGSSSPPADSAELAAYETSTYNWTRTFRRTNGQRTSASGVYSTVGASITFNTGKCW
jgi:hypothetical protein